MRPRRTLALLACLLAFAGGLRAWYLLEMRAESAHLAPAPDARYHDYWARALVSGDWTPPDHEPDPRIRQTPFFRQPGYPYALAALYRVLGAGPWAARAAQMCLGLLGCLLAYLLGRRVFSEATGLVFAALMSCYWSFIYFEGELLEPALLVPLELLLLLLLVRWTRSQDLGGAAAAGAVLGALALVRSTVLPFGALVPLWSWHVGRRQGLARGRRAALTAAYAGAAVLVIAPATVRNALVSGEFVLISANDGINLYLGNNPQANGMVAARLPDGLGEFESCFDYPAVARAVERRVGRTLSMTEVSSFFRRQAWAYAREHPGRIAALALKKTLLFWGPYEVAHNREDELVRRNSALLRWLPGFPLALTLALLGLGLFALAQVRGEAAAVAAEERARQREAAVLVAAFVAIYFATHLPFFVAGRYRVPMVPFLLLFGAHALQTLGEAAVRGRRRAAAAGVAAAALLYLLVSRNYAGYRPDQLKYYNGLGYAYTKAGRTEEALAAYRQALRVFPYSAEAHVNLGLLLKRLGRGAEAERSLLEALAYEPDSVSARLNLGMIYQEQGRVEQAGEQYRRVLALRPDFAEVHVNLGFLLRRQGRREEAKGHFLEALRHRPLLVEARLNLGDIYREEGRPDLAAGEYRQALALRPDLEKARELLRAVSP